MTLRILASIFALGLAQLAMAQSTNLRVTASSNGSILTLGNGGSLPIQSDGRPASASVTLTNGAASAITISQISLGSSDFALTGVPVLPATIGQNGTLVFGISYTPTAGRASTGQVSISYTEAAIARSFTFTATGVAPDYAFQVAASDGARANITSGQTIVFPAVRPNTSRTLSLIVSNRGSAAGIVNSATSSGADFSVGFTTAVAVPAGQEVSIPVTFTPHARGVTTGSVTLGVGSSPVSFGLSGTGAAPEFLATYALRIDGNARPLTTGGKLIFAATPATTTAIAEVTILNQGNLAGTLKSVTLAGAAFSLASLPLFPATIEAGQSARFLVQFAPRQLGSFTGTLAIDLDTQVINASLEGSTANPDFGVSYIDPATRNTVAVPDGGVLALPPTIINSNTTYTIVLRNRGEGTGFVNAVAVDGEAYQVVDLPAFPVAVIPANELRFGLRFNPKTRDRLTGSLRIELSNGVVTIPLAGNGIGPDLRFDAIETDGTTNTVAPGGELSFSSPVGQTTTKRIRIANTGNSDAQISAISVTGTGFALANIPFLPATITPAGSETISVTFTPAEPGAVRGRLRIGDQSFDLTGNGLAPRLEFSYVNQAGTTPVGDNQAIVLSPTRVGETSTVLVLIQNTGTVSVALSTIDSNNAVFVVENAPALPVSVSAGGSLQFTLRFQPNNVGNITGVLRINSTSINIAGSGREPVALPDNRIEGVTASAQAPMQQPSVSVTLASPYNLPLRGNLVLTFTSDVFADNPAVQFVTGGRSVPFTIPANSTRAIFDNGSNEVKLQTGTVAGIILVKPTFTTLAGLDVTPASTTGATITITRSAPRLVSAEVASRSSNAASVVVTGYSTTRTLRQLTVQINSRNGQKLSSNSLTANIESASLGWFQSSTSQSLGGLFSVTIPITLQRGDSTENLLQYIQSLGITISNDVGASNSIDVQF